MGRQAGRVLAWPIAAGRGRGSPVSASLTRTSDGATLALASFSTPRHDDLCLAREIEMEPPLAGSKPRLRLRRLLGLTDLHANLYPYDYYRDRQDDSVGLARAASLVRQARREAPNCLLFDNGDILQGTPLGDFAAEAMLADPSAIHPVIAAMNVINYDGVPLGTQHFT